jgi:hypothetical protein
MSSEAIVYEYVASRSSPTKATLLDDTTSRDVEQKQGEYDLGHLCELRCSPAMSTSPDSTSLDPSEPGMQELAESDAKNQGRMLRARVLCALTIA